jgi:EmrB/QacA subfamily drug resistance transporter
MKALQKTREANRYVVLVIVLVGVLMSVIDGVVVSIALPTITSSLGVDLVTSQWIMTGYMVTLTALLLFFGRLSERTGRTNLFTLGLAVFTLASLACGLARSLLQLIAFRVVQAVGAAMVFSISGAILFLIFPPQERGRAMGYLGSTVAVGSILGPILGGFLVDTLGWRAIFLINLPIGIVLVAFALVFLRRPEERAQSFEMDWLGTLTLAASLVSLMVLLSEISREGPALQTVVVTAAVFAMSTASFLLQERRCRRPLLDLGLFRIRRFLVPLCAMMLFFVATFMMNIAGPFYFQGVIGLRPTQVGLVYLIVPLVMVVASPLSGWLYDRLYWRHYGAVGMVTLTVCYTALGLLAPRYSLTGIVGVFVLLGLGSALFQSPNNTEVMNGLPKSRTAVASSVSATVRNLGMTLGVALASVMLTLQLRGGGYQGEVLLAGKDLLAGAVGKLLFAAGALCLLTVVLLLFNRPASAATETE